MPALLKDTNLFLKDVQSFEECQRILKDVHSFKECQLILRDAHYFKGCQLILKDVYSFKVFVNECLIQEYYLCSIKYIFCNHFLCLPHK